MSTEWNYAQYLMQSWMVGYEKAILANHFNQSKKITDEACFYAVEDWTQRLYEHGKIDKILGKELNTFAECINHHVDNLIKGGLWTDTERPRIEEVDQFEVLVHVPVCTFKEGCKWALEEEYFNPVQLFRCQRVGSFVGAIRKYLKEGVLPLGMKPDYFMTRVHKPEGCSAVVFGRKGFEYHLLLEKYNLKEK